MWRFENSVEMEATPEAVWQLWSDVAGWPRWDAGIEGAELSGPFAEGSTGTLTPVGQEPSAFSLTEVRPLEGFVDETQLPGAVLRFGHRLVRLDIGRVRITHLIELEGESADSLGAAMGPALSSGVPAAMATLASLASDASRTGR